VGTWGQLIDPDWIGAPDLTAGRRPEHGSRESGGRGETARWRFRRSDGRLGVGVASGVGRWAGTSGRRRLKWRSWTRSDHGRHHAQCRPKSPVAGCLDRRMVQMRFHAMGEGHAGDVPSVSRSTFTATFPASALSAALNGYDRLLLLQHCRRATPRRAAAASACVCQGLGLDRAKLCSISSATRRLSSM